MARPKVVILGMLTKIPVGGVAWLVGQYAAGFERLGFQVFYVEAHARTPSMFMTHKHDDGTAKAVAFIAEVMARFGLEHQWAFQALHEDGACYGMTQGELSSLYRDAALIINLHGGTMPLAEHAATGRLIYLGTDPVELELELDRDDRKAIAFLEPHVAFFTWGLNYGNPDCTLPWSTRFPFVPSPPPVVVDMWSAEPPVPDAPFTTIGNWRQDYRDIEFQGTVYRWSKHREFLKVIGMPARTGQPFELALSSYVEADRERLERKGWRVRPGMEFSQDVDRYRDYIQRSRAEFSVAKEQNVHFRSGWFSERSATYLAAGRPVIVQDTGFGNALPTGEGLFGFDAVDDAVDAVKEVTADYERHSRRAREIARDYFNYDVVLGSILDHAGIEHPGPTRRSPHVADPALPASLRLTPVARRPLRLPPDTVEFVVRRPVPALPRFDHGAPSVSVIVVVLDNLAVTRMALESLLLNTGDVAMEVLMVDNGSGDETRTYLSVLAARNPHVRVIRNPENVGFAAAVNQGLRAANADLVVLLNNDTIVPPGWLAPLADTAWRPDVGLVGPLTNRCGNEAEVAAGYDTYGEMVAFARGRSEPSDIFDIPVAVMFCVAFRRELVGRIGFLDERFEIGMFEDDDYSRRVRAVGLRVVCTPAAFVHHFGEASLGSLFESGRHGDLFDANRRRFEAKWETEWTPHGRRPRPGYADLCAQVRAEVDRVVPSGSVVLVISKGDDAFMELPGREGWHFPRLADGRYSGHHPAGDQEAIGELEQLRAAGGSYLVVPASASWWLDHYQGFRRHLEEHYPRADVDPATAVIFHLGERAERIGGGGA